MSSILRNALDSIEVGMEDSEQESPARVASAIRNLYAGVLLLCKEKLRQMSPVGSDEVLLYSKFQPVIERGAVVFRRLDKITVGADDIIRRFDSLSLSLDFKHIRRLGEIRNNIEHRAPTHPVAVMREAIAATRAVVVRLLKEQLGLAPTDVLSRRTWQRILKEAEVQDEMQASCRRSIDSLDCDMDFVKSALRDGAVCPECGSALLEAQNPFPSEFRCQACGESFPADSIVVPALESAYGISYHEQIKDGGGPAIEMCPTCNTAAFVVEEDRCGLCGEGRPYARCMRCGSSLALEEQQLEGLCSWCEHMASKDD